MHCRWGEETNKKGKKRKYWVRNRLGKMKYVVFRHVTLKVSTIRIILVNCGIVDLFKQLGDEVGRERSIPYLERREPPGDRRKRPSCQRRSDSVPCHPPQRPYT